MGANVSKRSRKEPAVHASVGGKQGNAASLSPGLVEGATQSLLAQPALWIGQPTSPCEQEADHWAERTLLPPSVSPLPTMLSSPHGNAVRAPAVHSLLSSQGPGTPLPDANREFFERRLGRDLGAVRLHSDDRADALNHALHSKAFTYGQSIFFSTGALDLHSRHGLALLAHELVHTLQQVRSTTPVIQRQLDDDQPPALPEVELRALGWDTRLVLIGGVRIGVLRTEGRDFNDSVQVFSQSSSMRMAGADPLETEPDVRVYLVRQEGVQIEFRERSGWQDILVQSRRWRGRLGGVRFLMQQSATPPEWADGPPLEARISRPDTTDTASLRAQLEDVEEELGELRTRVSLQQLMRLPVIDYRWYRPRLHPRRGFLAYLASIFVNDVYAGSVRIEVNDRRFHLQRITPNQLVRFEEEVSAGAVQGRERPLLSTARIRVLHSPAVTVEYLPMDGSRLEIFNNLILNAGVRDFDVQIVEDASQDWPEAYTDEYLEEVWEELGPDRFIDMATSVYERRLRRFDQAEIERQEDQVFFPAGRYEPLFEAGGSGPAMVSAMRRRLLNIRHNERMSEIERLRDMYTLYLDYMSGDEGLRQTLSTLWAMEFAVAVGTPAGAGVRASTARGRGGAQRVPTEAPAGTRVVETPAAEAVPISEPPLVAEPMAARSTEAPAARATETPTNPETVPAAAESAGPPRPVYRPRSPFSRALRLAVKLTMEGMHGANEVVTPGPSGGARGAPAQTSAPVDPIVETPPAAEAARMGDASARPTATRPRAATTQRAATAATTTSETATGAAQAQAATAPGRSGTRSGTAAMAEAPLVAEAVVAEGGGTGLESAPSPGATDTEPVAPAVTPEADVSDPAQVAAEQSAETTETTRPDTEAGAGTQAEDPWSIDITLIQRCHELADALQNHHILGETAARLRRVTAELLNLIEQRQFISEESAALRADLRGLRRGSAERRRVQEELDVNQGQMTVSRSVVERLYELARDLATLLERGLEGPARRGPNYRALQSRVREDQVFGTGRTHPLSIDHTVTVFEIMRMEGFARLVALDWDAAMSILDSAENLVVMPLSANASRGNQTWRQWRGWLPIVTNQPALWRRVQQEYSAREERLRTQIQEEIHRLLQGR